MLTARALHAHVEKVVDDVWIAEKFQSNSDIAGSPRNSFRASLIVQRCICITGGKALIGLGVERLPNPFKLRMPDNTGWESDSVR